jgi:hypothetical protein
VIGLRQVAAGLAVPALAARSLLFFKRRPHKPQARRNTFRRLWLPQARACGLGRRNPGRRLCPRNYSLPTYSPPRLNISPSPLLLTFLSSDFIILLDTSSLHGQLLWLKPYEIRVAFSEWAVLGTAWRIVARQLEAAVLRATRRSLPAQNDRVWLD